MFLKYLVSTDHKVIGLLYAFTSLFFLLVGFALVVIIRWQLAFPGEPVPHIGALLGAANAPGGIVLPEFYNQLGAMHGTIMVFLGVVPLAVGAFGNYIVPLQIGAPDMAFPRLNLASYWFYTCFARRSHRIVMISRRNSLEFEAKIYCGALLALTVRTEGNQPTRRGLE